MSERENETKVHMPSERLAQEFHAVGDFDAERKAREGYWSDFRSPLVAPQTELYTFARKNGYHSIAQGVLDGRFDG